MTESILIVGAGVFGLSTGLELIRKGYTSITIIDKHPIPSPLSAANDFNKIIRTEYSDPFYTKLSIEALKQWENEPLFKDVYHKSGRIQISPNSNENTHRLAFDQKALQNYKDLGIEINGIKHLQNGEELGILFPQFKHNGFKDIIATYNPNTGFGHASDSLLKVYNELVRSDNIKFIFGTQGSVTQINEDSVKVESGDVYKADKILITIGASTGEILDLQNQIKALGLFITHIKLNQDEYEKHKEIPIFFSSEFGYFFPPDPKTHHLKIALTYSDTSNSTIDPFNKENTISLPRYHDHDTFPNKGESHVRKLLQLTLPDLQNHQLFHSKVCWISDTSTSDFLIDKVPFLKNVYVATGDSGHGYKFLPNIGKYIVLKLEDALEKDIAKRWQWKKDPEFPKQFASRSKREHVDIKEINDWYIDP